MCAVASLFFLHFLVLKSEIYYNISSKMESWNWKTTTCNVSSVAAVLLDIKVKVKETSSRKKYVWIS